MRSQGQGSKAEERACQTEGRRQVEGSKTLVIHRLGAREISTGQLLVTHLGGSHGWHKRVGFESLQQGNQGTLRRGLSRSSRGRDVILYCGARESRQSGSLGQSTLMVEGPEEGARDLERHQWSAVHQQRL